MAGAGLVDEKAGTALHIFRLTGNLILEFEGAGKTRSAHRTDTPSQQRESL